MKKNVVKVFATVCAMLLFGLVSCSKSNEDKILGTWDMVSGTSTVTISGSPIEEWNGTETEDITFSGDNYVTFKDDGTMILVETGEGSEQSTTLTGTYTVKDDQLDWILKSDDPEGEDEISHLTIQKLDKKEMVLTTGEEMSQEGMTMKMDITFSLKKRK